ncbi:MAG: TraB/GumN family protein, partial [Cytophagaceae bacterium]
MNRIQTIFTSIFLVFSFISFSIFAQTKTKSTENGLLWEISGNGLKKPSYLYGTMHVSNKIAFHLPESFFEALKNTDMIALEINPDIFVDEIFSSPFYKERENWERGNGDNFYTSAFYLGIPTNNLFRMVLSKEDHFANYLLYRSRKASEDFQEDTYLDLFIYQAGKKLNKKITGLEKLDETIEFSYKAVMEETGSKKENMEYTYEGDSWEDLEDAYRRGDLNLIDSISRGSETKLYREYMLFKRNAIMVERMDSILKHHSLFAGVGAAHLPGEMGMLNMLREKGYTVRVIKNDGSHSKMKDKIENMTFKNTFTKHYAEDSLFEVNVPGKVFQTPTSYSYSDEGAYKEYFCADMANGAYYSIIRQNTYGLLTDLSQNDYYKKIDSILFENIPGKILKKKRIVEGNIEGFDILNVTKTGNQQRYKIYITPLEVVIFKVAGIKKYATKEGNSFISSIKFRPARQGENTFASKGAGFSVKMPGDYIREDNSKENARIKRDYMVQSYDDKGNYYLFSKTTYPDFTYIEEDTFELYQLAKNFCKEIEYKISDRKFATYKGSPVIDIKATREDSENLYLRVLISGPEYFLMATKNSDSLAFVGFASTFNLTDKQYAGSFTVYEDTLHGYKVTTPVPLYGEFLYKKDMKDQRTKERKEKDQFFSNEKSLYYVSLPSSEVIEVVYNRFTDFFSMDKDEFWEQSKHFISDRGSLVIEKEVWNNPNETTFLLTDTNSSRAVKTKLVLADNLFYIVKATIDTTGKESKFVSEFFNSFAPLKQGEPDFLFTDKSKKFFEACASDDTTIVKSALYATAYVNFQDSDLPNLISILEDKKFTKNFTDNKFQKQRLIEKIVAIETKDSEAFVRRFYKESSDSAHLQLIILNKLAGTKNQKSYKLLSELLASEAPLYGKSDINRMYNQLYDSLQLAAKLFPSMLELTRYPEYKENSYRLLAALVDSGFVKSEVYKFKKDEILRETSEELKRRVSQDSKSSKRPNNGDILGKYSALLIPFYNDKDVKQVFHKMVNQKDKNISFLVSLHLLKANQETEDSLWVNFSKNDFYRVMLYNRLKDINRLDRLDSEYNTQEALAKALLCGKYSANETDTVVFIDRRIVTLGDKSGYVYFFKRKKEKEHVW